MVHEWPEEGLDDGLLNAVEARVHYDDDMKPYRVLAAAVLLQAIADCNEAITAYERDYRRVRGVAVDALRWIFGDSSGAVLTYADCCDAVGLRPDRARARLLELPRIKVRLEMAGVRPSFSPERQSAVAGYMGEDPYDRA